MACNYTTSVSIPSSCGKSIVSLCDMVGTHKEQLTCWHRLLKESGTPRVGEVHQKMLKDNQEEYTVGW